MIVSLRWSPIPIDAEIGASIPCDARELELPGIFYDYLWTRSGRLVGLRYYGMSDTALTQGPLAVFREDPRFYFSVEHDFLDVVFYMDEIHSLHRRELEEDSAQEFGGDRLLVLDGILVLCFDLAQMSGVKS